MSRELVLGGALDLAGRPRLAAELGAAMAAGIKRIVLEVRDLEFIDGRSAALIEDMQRNLRAQGGELTLSDPPSHVRRVMDLCVTSAPNEKAGDRAATRIAAMPREYAVAVHA
jgi:anti-anti-sigma factor